jgi:hypothetical protein
MRARQSSWNPLGNFAILLRNAWVARRSVAEQLPQDSGTVPDDLPGQGKCITKGGLGKIVFRLAFQRRPDNKIAGVVSRWKCNVDYGLSF